MTIKVIGLNDEVIEYCSTAKLGFFCGKNIATRINQQTLRCLVPYDNDGNEYNSLYTERQCVVCGNMLEEKQAESMCILPQKYYPDIGTRYKEHNHMNNLCGCRACGREWKSICTRVDQELGIEYGGDAYEHFLAQQSLRTHTAKDLSILLRIQKKEVNVPADRVEFLLKRLSKTLGQNITLDNVDKLPPIEVDSNPYAIIPYAIIFQGYIATHRSVEQFILFWREKFLQEMRPRYMHLVWMQSYRTKFKGILYKIDEAQCSGT